MKELRKLAEAATPGPWATLLLANGADVRAPHASGGSCWVAETRSNDDAAYIAAASPDVVLRLLDVVEKAKTYFERYAQDEADDGEYLSADGAHDSMTGCSPQQARDALARRTALSSLESADKSVQLGTGGRE